MPYGRCCDSVMREAFVHAVTIPRTTAGDRSASALRSHRDRDVVRAPGRRPYTRLCCSRVEMHTPVQKHSTRLTQHDSIRTPCRHMCSMSQDVGTRCCDVMRTHTIPASAGRFLHVRDM